MANCTSDEADRLRDSHRFAEAALSLRRGSWRERRSRTDLRVQYGNMLKDSGQPRAAVEAYMLALAAQPVDPDIHLQLGHALKSLGRRAAAVGAYRDAARLGAGNEADCELAALGEVAEQNRLFAARPWAEALRQIADLRNAVEDLCGKLNRMSDNLPALGSLIAVPIESYDRYRAALAIPPAPFSSAKQVTVLCHVDEVPPDVLACQIASVRRQTHGAWRLLVLGREAGAKPSGGRAAASRGRAYRLDRRRGPFGRCGTEGRLPAGGPRAAPCARNPARPQRAWLVRARFRPRRG